MAKHLIAGTRGSILARWQTDHAISILKNIHPNLRVDSRVISTKGDEILDRPLAQIGDKGLFTKELEKALLNEEIDFAVHSLKDLPTTLPEGLKLTALLPRHAAEDVLVARDNLTLSSLPKGAHVGTGSLRRKVQLSQLRPDLSFSDLRGNIHTRLEKLDRGDYDAIIMARAALERVDLSDRISHIFTSEEMLPAVGQGVIAVEIAANREDIHTLFEAVHDRATALQVRAERSFLARLEGGCESPIAAHAVCDGETITLQGFVASVDGSRILKAEITGEEPEALGVSLAETLLSQGAAEILG